MTPLLTNDLLRAIAPLRIVARQVPRGGRPAEQRSRDLGSGVEFRDFRSYVPGDDVRRLDWNLYRRSGRLFLRLYEQPEDLAVYVLLDVSDSMYFEGPPRSEAAGQMAAVIAAVSLSQFDRVAIYPFGAELGPPHAATGRRSSLPRVFEFLGRRRPAGATDFARSLTRFGATPHRAGLAVVISDFFDPRGLAAMTSSLRSLRHRLLLIQVVKDTDESPDLGGEVRLVDCESGTGVEVAVTPARLARYRESYQAFREGLASFAARRREIYFRLNADRPLLRQLGDLFVGGVLRV